MLLDLSGKKALVTGIANNRSIAWGIAQQLHQAGAELGITYLPDEKGRFEAKVGADGAPQSRPVSTHGRTEPGPDAGCVPATGEPVGPTGHPCSLHRLCQQGANLVGDFSNTTAQGFRTAMDISAYSLTSLCRLAKPLFSQGASVITLTYLGAERAVPNYNVMGLAKAALEASVRYLASELGPEKQVRVNAISAGPIRTLASSAVDCKAWRETPLSAPNSLSWTKPSKPWQHATV